MRGQTFSKGRTWIPQANTNIIKAETNAGNCSGYFILNVIKRIVLRWQEGVVK